MKKDITFDELLKKIPNKYVLTITAGKRCRDIGKGAPILVKASRKDTDVRKAFKEILDDKIGFAEVDLTAVEE